MRQFVVDASVALAWFIDRPIAPYALHIRQLLIRGSLAVVPALWQLEVANGFMIAERRGLLTPVESADAMDTLDAIVAPGDDTSHVSMRRALATARAFTLTAYDAVYLELALRRDLPLATLDHKLMAAAAKAGIEVIQEQI